MSWDALLEGWGLSALPRGVDLCCSWCNSDRVQLYTDQALPTSSSPSQYRKQLEQIRSAGRVWCKRHAVLYFEDR